ncbi:MAG: hypothetical protein GC164_14795, partial [Phycisphaera sp.]|nr:hypothetical protein [Phycisphaera sp.]
MPPADGPGGWQSYIPVWSFIREAYWHARQGEYTIGFFVGLAAAGDAFTLGGEGLVAKLLGKAALETAAKELAEQTAKVVAREVVGQAAARSERVVLSKLAGRLGETAAEVAAREAGYTVLESAGVRGAVKLGFDLIAFKGVGAEAKLLLGEVKNVAGNVSRRSLRTLLNYGKRLQANDILGKTLQEAFNKGVMADSNPKRNTGQAVEDLGGGAVFEALAGAIVEHLLDTCKSSGCDRSKV